MGQIPTSIVNPNVGSFDLQEMVFLGNVGFTIMNTSLCRDCTKIQLCTRNLTQKVKELKEETRSLN